jgi:glycerol-3-phosphate dehydrogenase
VLRRDLDLLVRRAHDVVIVGGGIHGAAAAWEAASRGLSVALVEAKDFGGGASWNSLKTIHGGLRHLQRLDLVGLRESARERRALLTIAPELVRPLAFVAPTQGYAARGRLALAAGLAVGDLATADLTWRPGAGRLFPRSRTIGRAEVRARVPGLEIAALSGGAVWWDAQVDSSERLVLAFLHAAADAGAVVVNRMEATDVLRGGEVVHGITARDTLTGRTVEVLGRSVINSGGPGGGDLIRAAGIVRKAMPVRRAVNLVLRRAIVGDAAVGSHSGGRYLFAVPWRDRTIVGTGYGPEATPVRELAAGFLAEAARAFPWAGLEEADVTLVHEGLVPAKGRQGTLVTRSRVVDHEMEDGVPGLLTVVAAKYTTARAVAERAVDTIQQRLARPCAPSRTSITPLPAARLLDGPLKDRVRRAVQEEMAHSLADVVLRRLDLGTAGEPAVEDVETVAGVLFHELGWDAARLAAQRADLAAFHAARRLG